MKTTKRIISLLVCLLMVLEIMPMSAVSAFAEEVPEGYTPVYTVEDLYCIRYGLDGSYILMNDIDLTEATAAGGDWDGGYGWTPIGEDASLAFSGIFDGNGYTISGMRITGANGDYIGLFGYIDGGKIKKLKLSAVNITAESKSRGAVCGYAKNAEISLVGVSGSIPSGCGIAGALGGNVTISESYNTAQAAIGITGTCSGTGNIIKDCYNTYACPVGIANYFNTNTIENCINIAASAVGIARSATAVNCYYLHDASNYGVADSVGSAGTCIALSEEQMKLQKYYSGLDFENVWVIDTYSGANYPQLRNNREYPDSGHEPDVEIIDENVPEGYTGIYNVTDLFFIRFAPDKKYILMADIDLTEATGTGGLYNFNKRYGWTPIGINETLAFSGEFDGNGHTISGMRIDNIQTAYAGLFGYVTGNITDLTLKDCVITSNVTNGYCGTLAGYSSGNIENINIENIRMTSKCDYTGGLVAQYEGGHISDVKVNGSINATPSKSTNVYKAYCGGIAGYVKKTDAVIERCANASAVTFMCSGSYSGSDYCDTYGYCGGIAGYVDSSNTTISESYNTGVLTATASSRCSYSSNRYIVSISYSYCGGIIGYGSKAVNCYNTASVSAEATANAINVSTYYTNLVQNKTYADVGGICSNGNVENCINLGDVLASGNGKTEKRIYQSSIANGTLKNNYYRIGTAEKGKYNTTDTATTAVSLTAAQMKLKAVFGLLDFDTVWFLDTASGINYPQLINNPEAEAESVTIASMPAKTSYLHHDALDIKGLKISVKYKGVETPVEKTAEMNMISGYDPEQLGEQTVTVSYLNRSDTFKVTVNELPVASVTPDKTSFSLDAGKTETITATVLPENATYKDITWTSDDESIATVDANGTVTAVSKGIAVITATAKSGAKADCVVTVLLPATSVSLDKESVTLNEGGTYALTASLTPAASTDTYTFASSNTDIVLVNDTGVVTGVSKGTATVTVTTSRGVAANCTVTVLRPATGVTLNATEKGLDRGETFLLKATVSPSDTTDAITWSSSAPDVASVTSAGKVTALAAGTAVITVTTDSGKTASCTVTVIVPATGIELSPAEKTVNVNNTCSFDVILTPSDANEFITWTSSDENVAVVDSKGIVTGKGRGTATITATTSRGYKATAKVNVLVPATDVTLSETAVSVDITKTYKLSYTLTPADSTDTVTWSSSDDSVLTVAADGTVTALKKGTAKAICTAKSGEKAECTVTVLVPAEKITLDSDTLTVEKGNTALLAASLLPAESTDTYTWSSSDTKVATVNNGTVTAVGAGTAAITVTTSRGKTAVCSVKVIVPATGVSLDKTTADVDINKTLKLTATLSPADCTDKVVWSSSNENIVTVAADGTVTAKSKGSATVTATAESGENASCVITVLVPAASVSVSPDFVELEENGTAELTAALTPADTTDTYTWVSSDESIAAVDDNGNVTATGRGTVTISAVTSRGVKGDCTVKIRFPADSITLADSDIKLDITKTAKLAATLLPAGANDVITWTSSDDSVVSVASDGTVTALKNGTATITAKIENGENAECKVTVLVPAEKAELDAEAFSLNVGEEKTLSASLTPADSTDTYAWSSSDPSVATVENGKVTAIAKGTAVITVTTSRGLTAECTVTVLVPAESVSFDLTEKKLDVNGSFRLTASIQPANSTDNITYSSSDPSIVSVASDGTVTALKKGAATLTATTESGKTATCAITVLVPASKIALDSESISLNVGENKTLKASLTPADTTDTYAWSSSAPSVATVENGKVTALAKGTAVITATTSRGLTAKCTVTVLVPAASVKFDVTSKNVNAGGSFKLTAAMQPANSTDGITYSSSNTAVATVAADGTVKAIGKGTATITAKTTSGKTATCTVTVLLPSTGIKLNKMSASMKTGESLTLTATLTPAGSTDAITWKTSNAKVATVSGGTVKAVGAGSATITATTASGKSASCNVTVSQSVTGVTLNKTEHSVTKAGQYLQLTATVSPSNAANKAVTWSSDNTKVATVDNNGKVTIIGFGVANITVKTADGNKTATCKITSNGVKLGDVDKDGKITAADARLALRKSVGLEKFSEGSDQFLRSDVDSDKKVTAADARLILRASVGLEKLPEGGGHDHIYNTAAKTVAPTCTAEGYTSNVCMICKQTIKSNTTKALGHSWKAATCTAPKTCTRCGAKEGSALGHNYSAATCTSAAKCTRCGSTSGSALGHSWKAATCTAAKTCTRCGAKEGSALGHNYSAATCTAAAKCTRCGATSGSALGHSWKAATCTAPKTCTRCGAKEGSALGHNYSAATCTSAAKCTRCGATSGSALGHNYVSGKCSRCGAEPEAKITLPTLPKTISYRPGSSLFSSTRVDTISITQRYYSYDNDITVTVYLSGECLYHSNGSGQSDSMKIGWKLYDSEGYVVDSGTAYSDAVKMGEKYKTDFIIFDLSPNETYRLEFLNVN